MKKGTLHLQGMLVFMGDRVFAKRRAELGDLRGKRGIDRSIAQRSAPCTAGNNGGVFAIRKMANAEDDNSFGKRNARENGSGDSAGIYITGVGDQAGAIG